MNDQSRTGCAGLPYWLVAALGAVASCQVEAASSGQSWLSSPLASISGSSSEPIVPIAAPPAMAGNKITLGDKLFHDKRFSRDGQVSCASCHALDKGGVDGLAVSAGVQGLKGQRNSPTVFNAGLNFVQFWDGRARTLEEQIDGPVHNDVELASDWPAIIAKLEQDTAMVAGFREVYGGDITAARIRDAIAAFERTLVTVDSPFDQFLRGDKHAISERAKRGYALFKELGCATCHQGANVGGNMFQRSRLIPRPAGQDLDGGSAGDLGRYEITRKAEDKGVFRVPSLRLAVLTAPYFHDGGVDTLEDAIRTMAKAQLGRNLTDEQVALLVAFLRSLPGSYAGRALSGPSG